MSPRTRLLLVVPALFAFALTSVAPASAKTAKPTSASTLKTLQKLTFALPKTAASAKKRNQLRLAAAHARRVAARKPCAAVSDLTKYRKVLRGIKVKSGKRFRKLARQLAALQPVSMKASRLLLANRKTKSCGGGVSPSAVATTQTKLLQNDVNGMKLHVDLPDLNFVARTAGGKTWTELKMPNTDAPAAPGKPSIPVASSAFAIPDGATLDVQPTGAKSYVVDGVDVFPAQPDAADDEPAPNFFGGQFKDAPFTIDQKAYKTGGYQPLDPASGEVLGSIRDLTIGGLQVPAAQYDAANKTLKVFTSVDVSVKFNGGDHTFNSDLASPWEQSARRLLASLLNAEIVKSRNPIFRRCGEEMLVITNPATLAAANQFATAKRAMGMRVSVVQTGASPGIGTTAAEIQSFIRSRLTSLLCIHPSYVTIMGDDDLVPTFTATPGSIPSDLQYSMKNDLDELPDLAVGRIIGNDQTEVGNAVTKIVGYETSPPTGAFLNKAAIAAQFQDDDADGRENRTFIQFAEIVRNGLVNRGVAVDRVYADSPLATPQLFNDGTPLPAALLKPTFTWTGTGAQVTTAWNDGRFM
ncbi:MAG: C25 family cysteine peptidase, partial [Thermoleophilaceae bacterium]